MGKSAPTCRGRALCQPVRPAVACECMMMSPHVRCTSPHARSVAMVPRAMQPTAPSGLAVWCTNRRSRERENAPARLIQWTRRSGKWEAIRTDSRNGGDAPYCYQLECFLHFFSSFQNLVFTERKHTTRFCDILYDISSNSLITLQRLTKNGLDFEERPSSTRRRPLTLCKKALLRIDARIVDKASRLLMRKSNVIFPSSCPLQLLSL